eukprot:14635251-Alexandrium_andersonii.AAC.1
MIAATKASHSPSAFGGRLSCSSPGPVSRRPSPLQATQLPWLASAHACCASGSSPRSNEPA